MPAEGVRLSERDLILSYEELTFLVRCIQREWRVGKVRISGGEPLVRPDIETFIRMLRGLDIPDVTLTTNGQRLAETVSALTAAGLRRINISLPSLDADTFRRLSRGGDLARTLAGIESARAHGLRPVKLNMLVLRGVNDTEVADALRFALERDCEMRFLELMPMGPAKSLFDEWFTPWRDVLDRLAQCFTLRQLAEEPESSARRYAVECSGRILGTVGFVPSWSDPFCGACNRLRITADGRGPLRRADAAAVVTAVREALSSKRAAHRYAHPRVMATTGG